jgi:hypothetical protein
VVYHTPTILSALYALHGESAAGSIVRRFDLLLIL